MSAFDEASLLRHVEAVVPATAKRAVVMSVTGDQSGVIEFRVAVKIRRRWQVGGVVRREPGSLGAGVTVVWTD